MTLPHSKDRVAVAVLSDLCVHVILRCVKLISGEALEIPMHLLHLSLLTQFLNGIEDYYTDRRPQQPDHISVARMFACALAY